jgi:hypothetical protein
MVDDRFGKRPVSAAAAVAIAKELNSIRNARAVIAYPAIDRLSSSEEIQVGARER